MFKKIASSFLIASALVGTMAAPSHADDSTFQTIVFFPVRVLGSGVGTVVGVPLGVAKDGTQGYIKATKWVAGKMGDEDGKYHQIFGGIVGGPFGFAGGGAYGVFDGGWHGMKTGYEQPFSKDAFTFKDE
ncbi:MAG: hypothetical protein K2X93_25595 [Candidatus Obscuribacterales bacterium]|nr:hypothetical protein [Candidatus Obscuribacterales bacterium]